MPRVHRHRVGQGFSPRRAVQLAAAALSNGYLAGFAKGSIYTGGTKAVCVPVLNCYSCPGALGACPIGSLQTAVGGVRGHFPFYVLGLLMLFGVVLGRVVCGFLCPFGLVQDLLHKIPSPKLRLPEKLHCSARYLKYLVLVVLVVGLPILTGAETGASVPYFCKYLCPAGTLGGGIPLLAGDPILRRLAGVLFHWKLFVLVIILLVSVFLSRPFCRYLCPLGAFYGLFNRFSFYRMSLDRSRCVGCGKCEAVCPMAVEVTKDIDSSECIRCGECRRSCPTGAISAGFGSCRADGKQPD